MICTQADLPRIRPNILALELIVPADVTPPSQHPGRTFPTFPAIKLIFQAAVRIVPTPWPDIPRTPAGLSSIHVDGGGLRPESKWAGQTSLLIQGSILGPILYLVLVSDMPDFLGIGERDNVCYADDTCIWACGRNTEMVERLLNERACAFAQFAARNGNFSTLPQEAILARDTKQRAGLVARLAHHLPRGEYLRHLAKGLVVGKVGYAAAVVVPPRLISVNEPTSNSLKATQVAINDVARTVIGQSRGDRVRIPDLLHRAGLPSLNQIAIKSVAIEAWKAFQSTDGGSGERNPIGKVVFPFSRDVGWPEHATTRSKAAGLVPPPLRMTANTFAIHASKMWNDHPTLRTATTRRAALTIAKSIAMPAPNVQSLPFSNSLRRINGMLMELAAETATNGTSLPTKGGSDLTMALRVRAVPKAPPVAARYEVPSVVVEMGESPERLKVIMQPVMLMFMGTWADIRPMISIFSPVSG
eukprot:snap_masked-scaffold12_size759060-processed-gene-6.3 protein:Tk05594 transcript:snap_masked-scaffold12_size759060-processed-gene-6.3-mRNA-1 annotation:"rna-directed dna polymerase from mobile element jockey-like"